MNQLIINGKTVDLSDQTNIGITFCANNIGELQDRQGNFTNNFKLPITKRNIEIFEWSNIQTSSSLLPYKKLKATYIQNGVELLSEGIAEIQSVDEYFNIVVYSGNLDFIDTINDITVGELYKNDTPIVWNLNSVLNYRNLNNHVVFPIINWRKDVANFLTADGVIDSEFMLPALTMPNLFTRLSNYTGYNITGNYLTNNDHLSMILTPNNFKALTPPTIKTSNPLTAVGTTGGTQISSGSAISTVSVFPTFRNENNASEFAYGDFRPSINKIGILSFSGEYQIKWIALTNNINESTKNCYIDAQFIDQGSNVIHTTTFGPYTFPRNKNISDKIVLEIETPEMTFLSSKQYKVRLNCRIEQKNVNTVFNLYEYPITNTTTQPIGFFSPGSTTTNVYPRFMKFVGTNKIAFGNALDLPSLFTMKVKDVLKDILNLRGIILQTNNYSKTIQFNVFEDVKNNIYLAKNWSSKLQSNKVLGFKFGNYAKKNNFKFKKNTDSEDMIEGINDYYFNLLNENLEDEKTVVQLGHSSTKIYSGFGSRLIARIPFLTSATYNWDSNIGWKILNCYPEDIPFYVTYKYSTTNINSNVSIPYCKMLGFQTLVSKYYNALTEMLTETKVLKIDVKLNVNDVSDFDFSIPIQINRPDLNIDGYFYVNKIENYKGSITRCEIVRI